MVDACAFVGEGCYAGTIKGSKFKKNGWAGCAVGRL